jgi:hypothetical protein
LANQKISAPFARSQAAVVAHLGAIQAQDYRNALWAVGLRAGATEAAIERAIAERQIVRTWPMRGTLHFVAAADARWMLELLTSRVRAHAAGRLTRVGLNAATLSRCRAICREVLGGGRQMTRPELFAAFAANGIAPDAQRGIHIVWQLAQEGLICFGAHAGKQPTFVLLEEWLPKTPPLDRAQALKELARRYFTSHGPATLRDFVWWSGLKVSDAKAAMASAALVHGDSAGVDYWMGKKSVAAPLEMPTAHLLPAFDQYLLGYRDRGAILEPKDKDKVVPGSNGVFKPTIILNGRVVGTWRRVRQGRHIAVTASLFARPTRAGKAAIAQAAETYGRFLGEAVALQFT